MNAKSFQELFELVRYGEDLSLADAADEVGIDPEDIRNVESFESAGVLTRDEGFVVRLRDGRRFFVTVQEQ
jgi:predicted transcriptional regulator